MTTLVSAVGNGSTEIEWADATLNPWTGCTKVSPGCAHCYIDRTLPRVRGAGRGKFVRGDIPLEFHLDRLDRMVSRRAPTRYFVNSLSDVFHEDVPAEAHERLFTAMRAAPQHTFMVLTKREDRMHAVMNRLAWRSTTAEERADRDRPVYQRTGHQAYLHAHPTAHRDLQGAPFVLPNLWLGVTIENRRFVHRADVLRGTPAAVRFISAEPLLGPLLPDADHFIDEEHEEYPVGDAPVCAWRPWADGYRGPGLDLDLIDWLIVGGESGAQHRPFNADWARELRDYCEMEGWESEPPPGRDGVTAFFFKQYGGRFPKSGGRELDGRTHDDMPKALTA